MQQLEHAVEELIERLRKSKHRNHRRQLDDMAERFHPELASVFPSTAVVKFDPSEDERVVPAGSHLETVRNDVASNWRSSEEVHLHPFDVTSLETGPPISDWASLPKGTRSVIRLVLTASGDALAPKMIRCHLIGKQADSFALLQLLCCSVAGAFARDESGDAVPISVKLGKRESSLFVSPAGLPPESRLLNDFFICPEHFTAVELNDLPETKGRIEILFALSTQSHGFPNKLLQTRCTTVINEFERELPMIEIDPTKDEWELSPRDGEGIQSVTRVQSYDRETGHWDDCAGWQLVHRKRCSVLKLMTPMFEPCSPPSRFVKVVAKCIQTDVRLCRGNHLESENGERCHCIHHVSPSIQPNRGILTCTLSGFREPLTNESFSRLLLRQAVVSRKETEKGQPDTTNREKMVRKLISGVTLESVTVDRYVNEVDEIFHGRRVSIMVNPENFPGGGYWLFVSVVARFLAAHSALNQFTRVAVRTTLNSEATLLPPLFGRRDSA